MRSGTTYGFALFGLGVVAFSAGCGSRTITTSAEDQHLLQGQGATAQSAASGPLPPSEAARATEPVIASALLPPISEPAIQTKPSQAEPTIQTAPENPARAGFSQPPEIISTPSEPLGDVFFDYDRFSIRSEAKAILETNARWLKGKNGMNVLIEGHCDERGTLAYNLILGERRAQSVKRYLQELGVPASQIQITSYGKERPFCREHREACWQQNRRAHVVAQ
jgi:peptidoglycan-associated lipoprotein